MQESPSKLGLESGAGISWIVKEGKTLGCSKFRDMKKHSTLQGQQVLMAGEWEEWRGLGDEAKQ